MTSLLVAVLLLGPPAATARLERADSATHRARRRDPDATAPGLPVHGVRPAQVVAAKVRAVLRGQGDPVAWKALATTLPELALVGGADVEATFNAARLADSVAAAGARATVRPTVAAAVRGGSTASADRGPPSIFRATLPRNVSFAGVVVLAGFGIGLGLLWRRGGRASRRSVGGSAEADRLADVLSLAATGIGVAEIARRTGMAQDAIRVLLGIRPPSDLHNSGALSAPAAGVRRPHPGRVRSSARRLDGERERLKAEITTGARRMRDGRLTYGTGR